MRWIERLRHWWLTMRLREVRMLQDRMDLDYEALRYDIREAANVERDLMARITACARRQ